MSGKNPGWRHLTDYGILIGIAVMTMLWLFDVLADELLFRELVANFDLAALRFWHVAVGLLFCSAQAMFIIFVWRILVRRARLEKELEAARRKAEQEARRATTVIDAIGDGVNIVDRQFRVLFQNRIHREMVGGDYRGEYCYRFFDHRGQVCDDCPVDSVFRDGKVHKQEKTFSPAAGRQVSVAEITASPLVDPEGNIFAGIEVVRDVSARSEAEKAVRAHAEFLQSLMDTIPNPIFYKDAEGVYRGCNAAFANMMGLSREQIVGRSVYDLSPRELADIYFEKDAELFARRGTQVYEAAVRFGDGSLHDVIFNKATYNDAEGRMAGLVGVILDISERKRAEQEIGALNAVLRQRAQELAAVNDELESFSFSLSHDLRLPLTRIYSAAQLLAESSSAFSENDHFLISNICRASETMEELIEAMLTLGRISRTELRYEEVDLSALAFELAAQLKLLRTDRLVEFDIASGLTARGDHRLLKVALENLMENAWKYTQRTGRSRIEVGGEVYDGQTVFFVRDNGAGFDMARAGTLFKPFQRLHSEGEFPGTGVGLATVLRVIQRHGGKIWAEGKPGHGATFYFTLP